MLDVIKNGKGSGEPAQPEGGRGVSTPGPSGKTKASAADAVTIGIDLGYTELRMVKVAAVGGELRLLDCRRIPYPEDMDRDSPRFPPFLRKSIENFQDNAKNVHLWAIMPSAPVEVQHIRVPRMAKKKVENAVYFMAKKNTPFDERNTIFDYEIQGEVKEGGLDKIATLAYTVPKEDVEKAEDVFKRAGISLNGLTIAPFATQNIFKTNWIPSLSKTVASLYIGRDWSRIDIFSGGNFVMTRGIKAGINSMIESVADEFSDRQKKISFEQFNVEKEQEDREQAATLSIDEAREILLGLGSDSPLLPDLIARLGLTETDVFDLVKPALERLVRQIERTFEHYMSTIGTERIDVIFVSSAMGVYMPIIEYIGEQLGVESDVLDPMSPENSHVKNLTADMSVSERSVFVPALGLALSDDDWTLNQIFTYKDKKNQAFIRYVNFAVMGVFAIVMLVSFGYFMWLNSAADQKKAVIAQYNQQLTEDVRIDETSIMEMVNQIRGEREAIKIFKSRYVGMATISELSSLTPSNIRILKLRSGISEQQNEAGQKGATGLEISGVVLGEPATLGSLLANYIFTLDDSPMFDEPRISSKKEDVFEGSQALHFTLFVKVI
ncbi:MAG: pilus assembly protein PilM [Deltaproteobacteria bacterium]|nr:pilus assembly protein PilM [Deltaproteobacteria bacterium]